jgi:hypothetical protein
MYFIPSGATLVAEEAEEFWPTDRIPVQSVQSRIPLDNAPPPKVSRHKTRLGFDPVWKLIQFKEKTLSFVLRGAAPEDGY